MVVRQTSREGDCVHLEDSEPDEPGDLIAELEDFVEAIWRGDVAAAGASSARLRRAVLRAPDLSEAREEADLLSSLVNDRWTPPGTEGEAADTPAVTRSEAFGSAYQLIQEIGTPSGVAMTLIAWASDAIDVDDTQSAVERLRRAKTVLEGAADPEEQRLDTIATAMLHRVRGELAEAEAMYADAARRSAGLDLPIAEAGCLADLAAVAQQRGDNAAAAEAYGRASALAAEQGLDIAQQWALCAANSQMAAGRAAVDDARHQQARQRFEAARSIYVAAGPTYLVAAASAAVRLGIVAAGEHDKAMGDHWFQTAEAEYDTLHDAAALGLVHFAWGNAALSRGDIQVAEPLLRRASHELLSTHQTEAAAGCLRLLGASAAQRGDSITAQRLFEQSLAGFEDADTRAVMRVTAVLSADTSTTSDEPAVALAEIRSEFIERGELGKAVSAAAGELNQLLRQSRFDEARRGIDELESLATRAMDDSRSSYVLPLLSYLPALLRANLAMAQAGRTSAWEPLRECHDAMIAAGAHLPAARTAIVLARICFEAGRTREAADRAIPALLALIAHYLALPDAGERRFWSTAVAEAAHLSLVAASRLDDRRLVAELIETVRGHAMPEPVGASAAHSLQALLSTAASTMDFVDADHPWVETSATVLTAAAAIHMPWRRIALVDFMGPARLYGDVVGRSGIVSLVVSR